MHMYKKQMLSSSYRRPYSFNPGSQHKSTPGFSNEEKNLSIKWGFNRDCRDLISQTYNYENTNLQSQHNLSCDFSPDLKSDKQVEFLFNLFLEQHNNKNKEYKFKQIII